LKRWSRRRIHRRVQKAGSSEFKEEGLGKRFFKKKGKGPPQKKKTSGKKKKKLYRTFEK